MGNMCHTIGMSLCRDYIEGLKPQDPDQLGSASLLLFGPAGEITPELAPLIKSYRLPPHADGDVTLSFGVGASGSGVPFHVHGHGWAECLHGAKVSVRILGNVHCTVTCRAARCVDSLCLRQQRWLLFPPKHRPAFDPDASSSAWLRDVLPRLGVCKARSLTTRISSRNC